ncbi:GreA/GreB family elongation factor [Maribacter flavus]|nr:GreA/GreB family elongation factor [Maribacter flavus]
MKHSNLMFGKDNFVMVKYYLETNETIEDYRHHDTLKLLDYNMLRASVVETEVVPADVVQIYSTIRVRSKSGWAKTFELVPPYEENNKNNRISAISSLGAKIIGLSQGHTIQHGLPGDIVSLTIEKVVQNKKRVKLDIPKETFEEILSNRKKNLLALTI